MNKTYGGITAGALLAGLLAISIVKAAPAIPGLAPIVPLPDGWVDIFETLPPGETLTVGMPLDRGCSIGSVEIEPGGYLHRTAREGLAYIAGDHFKSFSIVCPTSISGLALHGDQDPKEGEGFTTWTFNSTDVWTPERLADFWGEREIKDITTIVIEAHGDSGMFSIYASPEGTSENETPTPDVTPIPPATPTEVVVTDETPTPTTGATPTSTPAMDESTATRQPTGLDPTDPPDGLKRVWLPSLSH